MTAPAERNGQAVRAERLLIKALEERECRLRTTIDRQAAAIAEARQVAIDLYRWLPTGVLDGWVPPVWLTDSPRARRVARLSEQAGPP